jgi:hypothetical protein
MGSGGTPSGGTSAGGRSSGTGGAAPEAAAHDAGVARRPDTGAGVAPNDVSDAPPREDAHAKASDAMPADVRVDAVAALPTGRGCQASSDCESAFCDTGWPGGYCTKVCTVEGHEDVCGSGAVCARPCGLAGLRCLARCSSACRTGYICSPMASGVGPVCSPETCELEGDGCKAPSTCVDEICGPICAG